MKIDVGSLVLLLLLLCWLSSLLLPFLVALAQSRDTRTGHQESYARIIRRAQPIYTTEYLLYGE